MCFNQRIENIPKSLIYLKLNKKYDLDKINLNDVIINNTNEIRFNNENINEEEIEKYQNVIMYKNKTRELLKEIEYVPGVGIEYFKSKSSFDAYIL